MPNHHIEQNFQKVPLNKIVKDWSEISSNTRTETFWSAEHESTNTIDSPVSTPIIRFFDGNEFHKRAISTLLHSLTS